MSRQNHSGGCFLMYHLMADFNMRCILLHTRVVLYCDTRGQHSVHTVHCVMNTSSLVKVCFLSVSLMVFYWLWVSFNKWYPQSSCVSLTSWLWYLISSGWGSDKETVPLVQTLGSIVLKFTMVADLQFYKFKQQKNISHKSAQKQDSDL